MSDVQNRIVGIVGRKGSGKSTRVRGLLKHVPRIVAWDPMAEFTELLPDTFESLESLEALDKCFTNRGETFACTYVPGDELKTEFEELCELVYDEGRLLFCVEEAPLVCQANYMTPIFGRIVRTGRHRRIDLLWTAQRASEVSRTLTSATDVFIFYSQTEPRDLDAIANRCGREIAEKVALLGLHDSFTWDVIDRRVLPDSPRLLKPGPRVVVEDDLSVEPLHVFRGV